MTRFSAKFLSASTLTVAFALVSACQQKGGPVRVDRVEPAQGIVSGGDQVEVHGSGFEPGKTQVEVRFGRVRADQVSIASNSKITVVTPPGSRGPVDVTLMFDDGAQFKIAEGFRYVPPSETGDVRKAFFSDKPGAAKPGSTSTDTVPAPGK
jgi:hypothetical protein